MSRKVYGRIKDGKLIEFPVYEIHIKNRAHPINWYTEALYQPKPEVDQFHYLKETPTVFGNLILVSYEIVPYSLNKVLSDIWKLNNPLALDGTEPTPPVFAEISPEIVQRVVTLTKLHVQEKLDAFAKTREYDDIGSASSYATSNVLKYKTEGERAVLLRDSTWNAFYAYLAEVQSGVSQVPKSTQEIDARMPVLTWE